MSKLIRNERCFYYETDIHFYDCGKNHKARIETILRHTADVAGIAYTAKGFSHSWLWERGFVFLLSRVNIKVYSMPCSEEHITLETWEREIKGALFFRDVNFYNSVGEKLISCSTAWSLVNPEERTIIKPSAFTDGDGRVDLFTEKSGDFPRPDRLKEPENAELKGTRKIVYSDIDGNGHTYNAVYSAIACDFLPYELFDGDIDEFKINFKQEAVIGEELDIFTAISNTSPVEAKVVGKLGEQERTSFVCEFIFK